MKSLNCRHALLVFVLTVVGLVPSLGCTGSNAILTTVETTGPGAPLPEASSGIIAVEIREVCVKHNPSSTLRVRFVLVNEPSDPRDYVGFQPTVELTTPNGTKPRKKGRLRSHDEFVSEGTADFPISQFGEYSVRVSGLADGDGLKWPFVDTTPDFTFTVVPLPKCYTPVAPSD